LENEHYIIKLNNDIVLFNIRHMAQTAAQRKRAQRARDRARLGDDEYKRIERDKMRAYRASKAAKNSRTKTTIITNNQPPPPPQPLPKSK
jgi:hypothetical protein